MNQIIVSLLQNDAYKFSMGQCYFHQHNKKRTKWAFKCRNEGVFFTPEMVEEIKRQVHLYCQLYFKQDELDYLQSAMGWLDYDYINFLKFWHPVESDITIGTDDPCGLTVEFENSVVNSSPYETPVMAIICEVYYRMSGNYDQLFTDFKLQVQDGIKFVLDNFIGKFSEFGFRRALSQEAHDYLIGELSTKLPKDYFLGTSNVYLAKKYGVKPMGTMAHEFGMVVGQGYPERNLAYTNKYMLESWVREYEGDNGIALTDTIGTKAFLLDFTKALAKAYDGVRHDSGDPIEWGEMLIAHYKKLGIDPKTKTLLFSDSLSLQKARDLYLYFKDKAGFATGIGGAWASPKGKELNIVIKPIEVDGSPVAKLPDSKGKCMCRSPEYVDFAYRTINWRLAA